MLTEKPRIPFRDLVFYGLWPGFIKVFLYRLKGYKIAKGVSLGFGSVICGDQVEIGESTSVGFLTIIRGHTIRLGPYVQIGSMTFLDTPHMEIGEGTKINEQVFVGGLQFPDSRFIVGRNCQILQMCFINPARSIVMGDDSGIGGHSLVFGHSSFHSLFDGYAVDFAPIEIGNNVGLAWRVFVLPGTTIGDGTMVGANSLVSGTIPASCMVAGFPARIVGKPPVFPKAVSDSDKIVMFRNIVAEMIQYLADSGIVCLKEGDIYEFRRRKRGWRPGDSWRMLATDGDLDEVLKNQKNGQFDVILSLVRIPN
ncbi:MAG TPA: hypothetical protein VG722_11465, partial [Tepidisphaeraceae bacterium]|nr:hypothetical protein [Tepidisphaeraceae bacterium]